MDRALPRNSGRHEAGPARRRPARRLHRRLPAIALIALCTACTTGAPSVPSARSTTDAPSVSSARPTGATPSAPATVEAPSARPIDPTGATPSAPATVEAPSARPIDSASATPGPSAIPTNAVPSASATPSIPSGSQTAASADFPVTLTDDEGTAVTLEVEPQRIVSLSPANTETLFALAAGDRVVGGTAFDDYPPEAAAITDAATFEGVLIEQVVDLQPDLVLAAGNDFNPPEDIARLRELGFPVLVLYAETVDEVVADIELIGAATGASAEAEEIAGRLRAQFAEVEQATTALDETPRVFYQIGSEPEIYGPAPDSFIADMIVLAGGEPITTGDPAAFSISLERLVAEDPEVIVVGDAAYGVCPDQVVARPGWGSMTAVRTGDVRPVDDTIVTRPAPRLGLGLAALARAIHPEIDLPVSPESPPLCEGSEVGSSPQP